MYCYMVHLQNEIDILLGYTWTDLLSRVLFAKGMALAFMSCHAMSCLHASTSNTACIALSHDVHVIVTDVDQLLRHQQATRLLACYQPFWWQSHTGTNLPAMCSSCFQLSTPSVAAPASKQHCCAQHRVWASIFAKGDIPSVAVPGSQHNCCCEQHRV